MSSRDRNVRAGVNRAPLRLHVECNFAAVRRCAGQVRAFLAGHGVSEKDIWACELAFVEGCNNAVEHTPESKAGEKLLVELSCESTHVELRINDHTQGFDFPAESRLPSPDEEKGRGIYLMRTLMDEVDYIRDRSSNCLVLKKERQGFNFWSACGLPPLWIRRTCDGVPRIVLALIQSCLVQFGPAHEA